MLALMVLKYKKWHGGYISFHGSFLTSYDLKLCQVYLELSSINQLLQSCMTIWTWQLLYELPGRFKVSSV